MKTHEVILIIGMVVVTFSARYVPLVLTGRIELPRILLRALHYVPIAVLTAITLPAMIAPHGTSDLRLSNAYFYGGLVAILIAWWTKKLLPTIVGGMVVFLVWQAVLGA